MHKMEDIPDEPALASSWKKVNQDFQTQFEFVALVKAEVEEFLMSMHLKTRNTVKKQKMRMIAHNMDSVTALEEVKAKVEKVKFQIKNNKFFQKIQEEMEVITQDTKKNEVFNYKLSLFLENLKGKKEKEDSYQLYLKSQIRDRKSLYKSVNQRNIRVKQEIRNYQREVARLKNSSPRQSLLNKSFEEHHSSSHPTSVHNQQSLDILRLLQESQETSHPQKPSQLVSLSNITDIKPSNDRYSIANDSSNLFQQTNQFQYLPQETYEKLHQKLVNVQVITKRNRQEFFQNLEEFFEFHEVYKSCMEYFCKNYVKIYQVQQNNQVHKSLLYQLKKNKQKDHQQEAQQLKEHYFKPAQQSLLSSTIQKANILHNSFKMASIKIEQQKEEPSQVPKDSAFPSVEVDWQVFQSLKANQLMAILQLRKDALDRFNSSIDQKKRELHICLRQVRLAQQTRLL